MFLYGLFFLSGLAGLIYQIVWSRELLLIFGNSTYSVTTVVSVFMLGLTLGSLFFGFVSDKTKKQIKLWGVIELCISFFSFLTIYLFDVARNIFLTTSSDGLSMQHGLFLKFILSSLVIILPTFFMGGTLPLVIRYFSRKQNVAEATSKLYFVNTFGAFCGTILSAFFLIELFGLRTSIILTCFVNFFIGLVILVFNKRLLIVEKVSSLPAFQKNKEKNRRMGKSSLALLIFVFFLSGIISMSYEIAWTRLLTPVTGTYVYAFALILAFILLGISLGAYLFKLTSNFFTDKIFFFSLIQAGIGLFAFFSLLLISQNLTVSYPLILAVALLPATILMGIVFPVISSFLQSYKRKGALLGASYAANTLGSIIGPILAGFYLIPHLGTSKSIIILTFLNLFLSMFLLMMSRIKKGFFVLFLFTLFILIFKVSSSNNFTFIDAKTRQLMLNSRNKNWNSVLLEDEVATIFAYNSGKTSKDEKGLFIDGVLTTTLTPQTKLLAHLPLLIHSNPKNLLVICFGMGTTFRSAADYDILVDAVELVPSVPKMFSMFHPDADQVLAKNPGNIFINDGRNYILMTKRKYDVIVVDPPPPVNAAGTTVLYSQEFYRDAKSILNDGGIFVQWFWYGGREDDLQMLFSAFRVEFPNILVAVSPDGRGVFFIGSEEKLRIRRDLINKRYVSKVYDDLNEWNTTAFGVKDILNLFVGDEKTVDRFIKNTKALSDDKPLTEYFFLRHKLNEKRDISADWVHPIEKGFLDKITID